MTRVECDVERKIMLNKEMLMKENRDWARSELETLTSSIQPWYARNKNSQTKNISLINNILLWRLNTWSYVFINTVEHHHSLDLILSSNFTMSKRSSIEEHFKEFQSRFSQTSETDSSKFSSAESFINEDDESFAETVILSVSIKN